MGWPTDDLQTTDLDSGSDTPPRAMFLRLFQRVQAIIAARGQADGVCELDANTRVPNARIGRAMANGVASLDSNARVPASQLPALWDVGDIKFSSGTSAPTGWLVCDGSILASGTKPALRTHLGSRFALSTDPAGTVRLPDARRAALIGSGGAGTAVVGATVGSRGGAETHTQSISEMPSHAHGLKQNTVNHTAGTNDSFISSGGNNSSTGFNGSGNPFNIMQPSLVVLVLIKT